MTREDIHVEYEPGNTETIVLGIDHEGKKQWYANSRDGWEEVGTETDGRRVLHMNAEHFQPGTKIELTNPSLPGDAEGGTQ